MDNETLIEILGFLTAQIAAVIAFWKWTIQIKRQVADSSNFSTEQTAEIKSLVLALLAELGYSHLAAGAGGQVGVAQLDSQSPGKELP